MAQQPTPAQWQEMQRQLEQQRTELENFRRLNAPKPIGAIFNSDRKSTRLNSSHITRSRMPSSA